MHIKNYGNQGNKVVLNKLLKLLEELAEHPFTGTGKPEQLKYSLSGLWSPRINSKHRLVYEVADEIVSILSVKGLISFYSTTLHKKDAAAIGAKLLTLLGLVLILVNYF